MTTPSAAPTTAPTTASPVLYEYLVIGGGIAGASVAQALAGAGRTLLVERESQPGYHSTGRSAAVFAPSYGPLPVRALTRASLAFFLNPPAGFSAHPLLTPRGALFVAEPGQADALQALMATLGSESAEVRLLSAADACARLPVLRLERVLGAVWDPAVTDIDVHALHQGFLRALRAAGGELRCNAEVRSLQPVPASAGAPRHWRVKLGGPGEGREAGERSGTGSAGSAGSTGGAGSEDCAAGQVVRARVIVNAAGAWCDQVAALAGVAPLGIVPKRRAAFVFAADAGLGHAAWPLAIGIHEDWYLKPDAGQWLGSPANADPTVPQDVQPEELDIALGMHRIEQMTRLSIGRPQRSWAGLRSFFADGVPVAGFDTRVPGFFWLAGQGGYGIQTAPALGRLAASLVRGQPMPDDLLQHGVSAAALAPQRLL